MKYIFILLFLGTFNSIVSAQLITKKSDNRYIYEGEIYKQKKLLFIFEPGSESYIIYQKGLQKSKAPRTMLFVSLGLFIGGNGMLFLGSDPNAIISPIQVIGFLTGYGLAPLIAIIAIPVGFSARSKLQKAIDLHNYKYIEINGYQKNQSYLNLSITNHGLGFVYSF